ncbi:MerR family transcriptional regulator [Actinomadura sp. 3N508]|uniref:MerR family transcriptional regulator n=1 Tax=Actinomadura sp. 3N508 TaxID=3375153 RepID=UPI00379DB643
MRIGELAALVGVSTRTVRHYHHLGLLPEPERLANGYREYRLRDAVVLARVRRLAELGLTLDEIKDVLADEQGRELREILAELDADLARQQETIRTRRARLAVLLADAELDADSAVSPEMADILRVLPGDSGFADADRGMLALVETAAGPGFAAMLRPLTEPGAAARAERIYARLDEIADAATDDPGIPGIAKDIVDLLPEDLASLMVTEEASSEWLDEMSPAQAEVFRLVLKMLQDRPC